MPKKHALGFGNGKIIEYEDGTAGYVPYASFTQAFRVKIGDVTGFSVTKGDKVLERTLNVLGNGTLLGSASVNHGAAEVIERWFRSQSQFGRAQQAAAQTGAYGAGVADELRKLAELREEGILSEAEFAAQKAKLLES